MRYIGIMIDQPKLDLLIKELPKYAKDPWKHSSRLEFEYCGIPQARVIILYSEESWRNGCLELKGLTNIKAANTGEKPYLSSSDMETILTLFYEQVLQPCCSDHSIKIIY